MQKTLYHFNPNKANPQACRATKGQCPWGGHRETPAEVYKVIEMIFADYTIPKPLKKKDLYLLGDS